MRTRMAWLLVAIIGLLATAGFVYYIKITRRTNEADQVPAYTKQLSAADTQSLCQVDRVSSISSVSSKSPDVSQIVFSTNNGLHVAITSNFQQHSLTLTPAGVIDWLPAWSPDGQLIAFVRQAGKATDLYIIHPDGTGLTRITDPQAGFIDGSVVPSVGNVPVWSPDSRHIGLIMQTSPTTEEVYETELVYQPDGRLMNYETIRQTSLSQEFLNLTGWSGDGSKLGFFVVGEPKAIYLIDRPFSVAALYSIDKICQHGSLR